MPLYGTLPATGTGSGIGPTALAPGESMTLFAASDSLTAGTTCNSIAISPVGGQGGSSTQLVFTASWATTPTASLQIQASNDGVNWMSVGVPITTSPAYYADLGIFAQYRANLASQSAGGALTCIVQRQA